MKPALRSVVDKNGATEIVFTPTAAMILYSVVRGDNPKMSDKEILECCKISRATLLNWRQKYGTHFENWLEEALDFSIHDEARVLDRFGLMQALQPGNFQYFREMARTRGVIKDEPKNLSLTINTDFSAILLAAGGDFNAARAKLLELTRGVVRPDKPGMASPLEQRLEGSESRAGNGAGRLQDKSVEMAHPLDSDRGCAKRDASLSAISEQGTPLRPDSILDVEPLPPGSKE